MIAKVKKGKVYCDIFGLKAFKLAKKLNVDGYKIHSSDLKLFFIKKGFQRKKKIFLSTGGSKVAEIKYALKIFQNSKKTYITSWFSKLSHKKLKTQNLKE